MKGERLFIERQTELLEHLAEEKDMTIKFKLAFLKCFSPLGRDLEAACQDFGIAVSPVICGYAPGMMPAMPGLATPGSAPGVRRDSMSGI